MGDAGVGVESAEDFGGEDGAAGACDGEGEPDGVGGWCGLIREGHSYDYRLCGELNQPSTAVVGLAAGMAGCFAGARARGRKRVRTKRHTP